MRILAALDVNLEVTPLGTRSRLRDKIAGTTVLRRTVERLAQCERVAEIVAMAQPHEIDETRTILDGLKVHFVRREVRDPGYRRLVQAARKWSLEAWRGGLGGSAWFDEYADIPLLSAVAQQLQADAVAVVPPGAALIDPQMTDDMLDHFAGRSEDLRLTFAQGPPGLFPVIFHRELLAQLSDAGIPPGWTLAYKPDKPQIDLAFRGPCFDAPQIVRYASGRLTCDTSRSIRAVEDILSQTPAPDALTIAEHLLTAELHQPPPLPREVEIELTTEDPLPQTITRPRGKRVPTRGPLNLALLERIARELAAQDDDALVVLRGHGDPLLHPQFPDAIRILREAGVYGLTVYTTAQVLPDDAIRAIVDHKVDAVAVTLDAWTDAAYAAMHPGGDLPTAKANIARLSHAVSAAGQPSPIFVPVFTKCVQNVDEMDAFFDGWIKERGCAVIEGYSHAAGQCPDHRVVDMSPPTRTACSRLWKRCVVLANGAVSSCDQDFCGKQVIGHLGEATLQSVWHGSAMASLRTAHESLCLEGHPLCPSCSEWCRP